MNDMSALALAEAIREKRLGVEEALRYYMERIEKSENGTFITIAKDEAFRRAKIVQSQINSGQCTGVLAGVPIAVKDNISTKGIKTTCASRMLENYTPVYDAQVIERLESAGMIIVGKLNMDEFAMGGSCETGAFGSVRNPWNPLCVAGGSSGGSAAAVASGEVPVSLGSDTGGSIRQPCSFCGVTGIKPTYGSVSRYGLVAYASSLDQIGTIGRDIDDCAALLSIIAGKDKRDGTCIIEKPFDFSNDSERLDGVRIGVPANYLDGLEGSVKGAVMSAADEFCSAGAVIEEFEMPMMEYMIPAYYIIACAEASSNLSRYDGLKYGYRSDKDEELSQLYKNTRSEGFGQEVKRRIMLGAFVLSSGYYDAYYKKALKVRSLIKDAYTNLFKRYDMILSPVAPTTAYKLGENIEDAVKMYYGDIYTVSVNLAGLPSAALPCGFDERGMPIGFQLIGGSFCEGALIRAGRVYQRRTGHHKKRPGGAE